jgi:hypothetical protein
MLSSANLPLFILIDRDGTMDRSLDFGLTILVTMDPFRGILWMKIFRGQKSGPTKQSAAPVDLQIVRIFRKKENLRNDETEDLICSNAQNADYFFSGL